MAREMERAGLQAAAADRRRDHLARAHGGQDRAELLRAGGLCAGRLAQRAAWCRACCRAKAARGLHRAGARRLREDPRRSIATRRARAAASRSPRRARQRPQDRLGSLRAARAAQARRHGAARTTRWPSSSTTSTGRRSSRPGSCPGPYPEDPRGPGGRRGRAQASSPRRRRCSRASCARTGSRRTACSACSRRRKSTATTSRSTRDESAARAR